MAGYERSVRLDKPLGIVLEETGAGGGVKFESFQPGGSAAAAAEEFDIAPGDRLLKIGDENVASLDFDAIMARLVEAPSPLQITVDDGLTTLDITPNLAKSLKPEEAIFADLVVRAAVREIRRLVGASAELMELLGELMRVEILLGAGTRDDGRCLVRSAIIWRPIIHSHPTAHGATRGMHSSPYRPWSATWQVRFFGIFSTSGGESTYSCNVGATGVRRPGDGRVLITALSCAKDEGWGRTIDLKRDEPSGGGAGGGGGRSRAASPRMSIGNDANGEDEEGSTMPGGSDNAMSNAPGTKPPLRVAVDAVGDGIFLLWTIFIQTAGFAFGLGLVANLCGYGYKFRLSPPSLEVGTLEEMRRGNREQRFVNEARQELFPMDERVP